MEHQFFIRQHNFKLYRSHVAASEAAAEKAQEVLHTCYPCRSRCVYRKPYQVTESAKLAQW